MGNILYVLLVLTVVKLIFISILLGVVFKEDIRSYRKKHAVASSPTCMYCQSVYTRPIDEGQRRWEGEELVLVTTYECQHCHLPFWDVQRIRVGVLKT